VSSSHLVPSPKVETPKTPPKVTQPLPRPRTPRPTHVRPPVGYYRALSEGEKASIACTNLSDELEEDRTDEALLTNHPTHWALATAEPEPMLKEALSGPDAAEWQEAIDYEISQLEKLGTWKIADLPKGANVIPCHFVLATK